MPVWLGQIAARPLTSSAEPPPRDKTVSSKRLSVTRYCQTGGGCKYKYFSRIQLLNEGSLSLAAPAGHRVLISGMVRSEERRVGKECGYRVSRYAERREVTWRQ